MLPSAIVNGNAGVGASAVLARILPNANGAMYRVHLNTGSASRSAGPQCSVSFGRVLASIPSVQLAPANELTASLMISLGASVSASETGLVISFSAADTASHELKFTCIVS